MKSSNSKMLGLFPTPVMVVGQVLDAGLLDRVVARARSDDRETNAHSEALSHSPVVNAEEDALYRNASARILPHVAAFGEALLGEALTWSIKEIWTNVLETGGSQAIHNHANSFVSGIVYLTVPPDGTGTVFHRSLGGSDYSFVNNNKQSRIGPYNASRWQVPPLRAGDMVLFPSYLLHEVPVNGGDQRLTMAFNALPERIESWGYTVRFG